VSLTEPPRTLHARRMSSPVRFVFSGKLRSDVFIAFARDRASRLDLELEVGAVSDHAIVLAVRGEPDLIDAFEMACSLGPSDSLVLHVERSIAER
jgi:hypothetical protein